MDFRQRPFTGLRPPAISVKIVRGLDGWWTASIMAADAPGYWAKAHADVYEDLSYDEAVDVVEATLDSWR